MSRRTRVVVAVAFGLASHALFVLAVVSMAVALYGGLSIGRGPFHDGAAWAANAALVVQFPVLHSWLLTPAGRAWLARLSPAGLGRNLAPTTFASISSLQLLATFLLWSPSGITLHVAHGPWLWLFRGLFAASWILLVKAIRDAGLGNQTGAVGWTSVLRDRLPSFGPFPTRGLFKLCRHPVYLAFALILWTGPVHSLDGLVLALTWSTYCVAAPLHKELRYLSTYGEPFSRYRSAVPYILPRIRP